METNFQLEINTEIEDKENREQNEDLNKISRKVSNNMFKIMLESLMEELPSKEVLQQFLDSNSEEGNSVTSTHSKIIKESSIYISCLEDRLSSILACKRYENGHTVSNLASYTLSYSRAFYANALASLQTEVKKSDHKKDWKEISGDFTDEAARKYMEYLLSQMNFMKEESDGDEIVLMISNDEINNNTVVNNECNTEQQLSQVNSPISLLTPRSYTPKVKKNSSTVIFDSTPNFEPYTPKMKRVAKKRPSLKSPSLTPVVLETSNQNQDASKTKRRKQWTKQLSKKKLNFSENCVNSDKFVAPQTSPDALLELHSKKNEALYSENWTLRLQKENLAGDKTDGKYFENSNCLKENTKDSINFVDSKKSYLDSGREPLCSRGKKIYASTLIANNFPRTLSNEKLRKHGENDLTFVSSIKVSPTVCCIVDTPVKRKDQTFNSPQSPPRKRLIFSISPKSGLVESQNPVHMSSSRSPVIKLGAQQGQSRKVQKRIGNHWKFPSERFKHRNIKAKGICDINIITLSSPELSCKEPECKEFSSQNSAAHTKKKNSKPKPMIKILSSDVISPLPSMPVPSLWAPCKVKRTSLRYRLPLCRRSLNRQFQDMSVSHQFMDTPPGSPGSFEPLPLMD